MTEDQLTALRKRILMPWQVQKGSSVWAPWGKSGWSAVDVKRSQRKWAKGMRVKPTTGEEVSKGRISLEWLIKRDPALKGKDRPQTTPAKVFAHLSKPKDEKTKPEPAVESKENPAPAPSKPKTPEEKEVQRARIEKLFNLFEDKSTSDDW